MYLKNKKEKTMRKSKKKWTKTRKMEHIGSSGNFPRPIGSFVEISMLTGPAGPVHGFSWRVTGRE